ncbi:MAG: sulfotransferase domain-containing protein [Phycisphaerales bacterium]
MSITWLASYPKSGNTWVRFLLYSAIYGPPTNSLDIAKKIPDIHRPIPFDPPADGKLLCKSHFAYSPKHPKIDQTDRAVLIMRDPRDVLFSSLNYRRLAGMSEQQISDEQYAKSFIAHGGDPDFHAIGFGSWSSHIQSWKNQTVFPVLTIRYEDIKADTATTVRTIGDFLGHSFSDDAIDNAIKASSFDTMRAMEIREKHQQAKKSASSKAAGSLFIGTDHARQSKTFFMNTGKSGQSLASISPTIEQAFNTRFGEAMKEMGYSL